MVAPMKNIWKPWKTVGKGWKQNDWTRLEMAENGLKLLKAVKRGQKQAWGGGTAGQQAKIKDFN